MCPKPTRRNLYVSCLCLLAASACPWSTARSQSLAEIDSEALFLSQTGATVIELPVGGVVGTPSFGGVTVTAHTGSTLANISSTPLIEPTEFTLSGVENWNVALDSPAFGFGFEMVDDPGAFSTWTFTLFSGGAGGAQVGAREPRRGAVGQGREHLAQAHAVHELHGQVGDAAVLADGVHGHDARVREARHGLGLAGEAQARVAEAEHVGPHELERHVALQAALPRAVDHAHAAAAQALQDLEVAQAAGRLGVAARRVEVGQQTGLVQQGQAPAGVVGQVGLGAQQGLHGRRAPLVGGGQAARDEGVQAGLRRVAAGLLGAAHAQASSARTGAWSLGLGWPRSSVSMRTPRQASRAGALMSRWSMRRPRLPRSKPRRPKSHQV